MDTRIAISGAPPEVAISTATRAECELIAARVIKRLAERQPLSDQLALVHLAVRLEKFAREGVTKSEAT